MSMFKGGVMNPIIDQTNYNGTYNTDDTITFSARVMGNMTNRLVIHGLCMD